MCPLKTLRGFTSDLNMDVPTHVLNAGWMDGRSCVMSTRTRKHLSKLDFETNLKFVNLYVREAFSYESARSDFQFPNKTICDWASFCREVLISWCLDNESDQIGGPGEIVEIDESKFGKRKYNVGRLIEGQWVFGGVCRKSRKFFFVPVQTRDSLTLLKVIKERIHPGTTVISDCWKAYNCLETEGYQHLTVNHSYNFVDPDTKAHTNTIERKWRDAKAKKLWKPIKIDYGSTSRYDATFSTTRSASVKGFVHFGSVVFVHVSSANHRHRKELAYVKEHILDPRGAVILPLDPPLRGAGLELPL
ncbi:uncharacterized protein LOC119576777 [Penaeus monodon]|uniref:uncharacterized protein LOC119576777 n=1 Tax=Penaeus monodon TaxID=6687 RepID=UPI0018A7C0DC|nr:uncharacterized protein LOC119576777 [Penaeus monodon]